MSDCDCVPELPPTPPPKKKTPPPKKRSRYPFPHDLDGGYVFVFICVGTAFTLFMVCVFMTGFTQGEHCARERSRVEVAPLQVSPMKMLPPDGGVHLVELDVLTKQVRALIKVARDRCVEDRMIRIREMFVRNPPQVPGHDTDSIFDDFHKGAINMCALQLPL